MNVFHSTASFTCDRLNYMAICFLEKLGIDAPTEHQIEVMERLITLLWSHLLPDCTLQM